MRPALLVFAVLSALARGSGARVEWVRLPGGEFQMGSEALSDAKPVHRVSMRPFEIARTPVTNGQYRACVEAGACVAVSTACETAAFAGDDQPAVCADYSQAEAFSRWAGGRLPSEAEWEYAARGAGKDVPHPWGKEEPTCARAVLDERGYGCGRKSSWPVCSKPKGNTAQGLCDMNGEAYEWTADEYHPSYDGAPADGAAWVQAPSKRKVVRGGSWSRKAGYLSNALRSAAEPSNRNVTLGFRPVRSIDEKGKRTKL